MALLVLGVVLAMLETRHREVARRVRVTLHGTYDPVTGLVTDVVANYGTKRLTCQSLKDAGLLCLAAPAGAMQLHTGPSP